MVGLNIKFNIGGYINKASEYIRQAARTTNNRFWHHDDVFFNRPLFDPKQPVDKLFVLVKFLP